MADKTFEANIYTPDWKFISVLKDYISIVWTDRYYEAGDFELILPLSKENLQTYAPDNYIICNQSDKVMIIEQVITSTSAEGYKMKVTGHSAEILLRRRVTPNEIIINRTTNNEVPIEIKTNINSHFAGALATVFEACFEQDSVEMMSEQNNQEATQVSYESRSMPIIRFMGVVSDPFGHIADAIGNVDSHGDEYYDIIQEMCESKDIGFAVYRNFEKEIDRNKDEYNQANTSALFHLVLYDGWNRSGSYLRENGADMDAVVRDKIYQIPSGIYFSVEYLNLQSSDSNYSKEEYKNYIFVKGDEINSNSSASVDVAEATANFTEAFTDENAKYYQVGTNSKSEYGIFRRETFMDSGISRGLNTRNKYASRLKAKGSKELKKKKEKWVLSSEISNVTDYIYREDYYLGDLVRVKDSMEEFNTFRVTEEIISCDAAGLKVYPTLVLFDEDKYIADDSLADVDMSARVLIDFKFNGGKLDRETARDVYLEAASNFTVSGDKYDKWLWSDIFNNNKVPLITDAGAIIDTIPSVLEIQRKIGLQPTSDNVGELVNMIEGVRTYQIAGDFAQFPGIIGTVSNNPSILGEYNVSKEFYDLRYWMSPRRFIAFEETAGPEEFTEVYGPETFTAHWSPTYYTIIFEHGDGGKYSLSSFVGSYCPITDIEAYSSSPPKWQNGKFYERTRDWNRDSYVFKLLYSMPLGWYDSGSDTYYDKYYMRSNDTDKIYTYCGYKKMPSEPSVFPEIGYRRESSKWEPTVVPAIADATYRAKWKREDEAEDEEEPDEDQPDEDWDDRDEEDTNSPVIHREGDVQDGIFVGDEDGVEVEQLGTMVTFRSTGSRLGDIFLPKSLLDWTLEKKTDGLDQYRVWLYRREISDGVYLQAFWHSRYSAFPGISFIRSSDGACIAKFLINSTGNTMDNQSANRGYAVNEVAFSNAPVVKKITGYKALTSNPISEDSETWPNNKIYRRVNNNYELVSSKPENWDTVWRQYYIKGQVGASYGICIAAYDDLGLLFNPLWTRLGIIDYPIVPVPFDTRYTSSALDIATNANRGFVSANYHYSGWVWSDIPDARWKGPAYISGQTKLSSLYSEMPKFHYDSHFGNMYATENGTALIRMPDDWETNWGDYYAVSGAFTALPKNRPNSMPDNITNYGPDCWLGPGFNHGTVNPQFDIMYEGLAAGIHIPLLKQSGNTKSLIITVLGYTHSQHVKPGTVAVFKVNVTSVVITASFEYDWQVSKDSGSTWESTGAGGSVYSFTATEEQSGYSFRCKVHASFSAFGEIIDGEQIVPSSGVMSLTVDDEGTDGKEPSTYEEDLEEKKGNTQGAGNGDPDPAGPSGDEPKFTKTKYNSDHKTKTVTTFKWIGSGDPPDVSDMSYTDLLYDPNFEVVGSTTYDKKSSGGAPSTSGSSSGADLGGGPFKPEERANQVLKNAQGKVYDIKSGSAFVMSGESGLDLGEATHNYSKSTANTLNEAIASIGGEQALSRQ